MELPERRFCTGDAVTTGRVYRVVDWDFDSPSGRWLYNLEDANGEAYDVPVPEDELTGASVADSAYEGVMEALDRIRRDLFALDEAVHKELDHVEAMQKCRAFDAMAGDLAESRATVAHMNSVRCWIDKSVSGIARIMEASASSEGEGEPGRDD